MMILRMDEVEQCDAEEIYGKTEFPSCDDVYSVFDHYVNACVPAALIQFEDQDNEPNMKLVYGVLFPILALMVLVTNGIVIAVLRVQNTKRAPIEPLVWMAVSALLMALSPLPFTIYYYNMNHMYDPIQTEALCYLHKICMEVLPFFFNTLITFFTLLLGTQRFIAVHYPLESFRWCTRKMVRRYAKLIVAFSLFLTSTHFFADTRVIYHFCIPGDISIWVARCFVGHSNLALAFGVENFAWTFDIFRIALLLIPSGTLFILTILLIKTIRISDNGKLAEQGSRHRRPNRSSANTTMMLTVIIVLFLLARLPTTVLILLVKISTIFPGTSEALKFVQDHYLVAFNNLMFMTVHPITFAVYMLMSRRFRVSLRRLLGWKFFATDEECLTFSSSRPNSICHSRVPKEAHYPLVNFKNEDSEATDIRDRDSVTVRSGSTKGVTFTQDTIEKRPLKESEAKLNNNNTQKDKFVFFKRIFIIRK